MIKFFRRIRQKLLSQNKFSRYILYAAGEILLVMVGILLALQVNNWSEKKKLKKTEIIYLKGLKQNFLDSSKELDRVIDESIITEQSLDELVELIKKYGNNLNHNGIDSLLLSGMSYTIFQTRQGVINELISSGQLSTISNEYLRSQIASWDGNLINLREVEEMSKSGFYNYSDRLSAYFDFSGLTPEDEMFSAELKRSFFDDLKTRNTIAGNRESSRRLRIAYIQKKQHVDTLIKVIDNELKNLNE